MPTLQPWPDGAWPLLLGVAALRRREALPSAPCGLWLGADGDVAFGSADDPRATLRRAPGGAFAIGPALAPAARDLVELYLPLLGGGEGVFVLAHLGQSADARIATVSGDSQVVTGRADFVHMHRLRALADAVLVGAGTVAADDPRLTTRLVDGPSPTRVVVDPEGRLDASRGVFRDAVAPTLRVCAEDVAGKASRFGQGHVDTLAVPRGADGLSLPALRDALGARGLRVVFVEGGGVTVTRWMTAALLDRLHLVAAPVLVGEGRPALGLPGAALMRDSLRPPCRLYRLGRDVLWDFDLRGEGEGAGGGEEGGAAVDDELLPRRLR